MVSDQQAIKNAVAISETRMPLLVSQKATIANCESQNRAFMADESILDLLVDRRV